MYSWLGDATADGAEIITASRRLSRELRAAYDQQQIEAGRSAWPTPSIRSWHDWLNQRASAVADPSAIPKRLDLVSSTLLMESCLRKRLPDGLAGVGGMIRQASQSWQRLREWQVPLARVLTSARSQDERVFADAAQEYRNRLDAGDWIDGAGMAELVAGLIDSRSIPVADSILLVGFDRPSPMVRHVVRSLENAGSNVSISGSRTAAPTVSKLSFASTESEMRAAGAWARAMLDENPGAKVAIVSPVLESNAPEITRLVREGFVPGWQYGAPVFASSTNVSYGRKLSEYPLIAVALMLLRWMCRGLGSRELGILLRSRCIGASAVNGRSKLELALRRYPDRQWTVDEFLRVFSRSDQGPDVADFFECAESLRSFYAEKPDAASPAEWATKIDGILTAVRWPGDASLDSSEFQLLNRWRQLLNEFARIEAVLPRTDLRDACQRLTAMASETLYQPETGRGLVQILGTLEAAGMEFDALWIAGLDASQWPPSSRPALLVNNNLQLDYSMPDATPGDTLAFAQRVLARLVGSAEDCVLSWARSREDAELTASSLIDQFSPTEGHFTDPGWYGAGLAGKMDLQSLDSDVGPPVTANEKIRGGAYTVQRQVTEPFDAFVHGRLGVRAPEPFVSGLSAGMRGNIIHNALHNLLADRPTQAEIAGWSAESRDRRYGSAIDAALAEHVLHADVVTQRLIGLERNRLRGLLGNFIDAEIGRPAFDVLYVEKVIAYEACGIRLGLRIDRVDKLPNGRLLIIDYKTGLSKNLLDKDGNPVDLQLVVYADALESDIGGLALMNVDSRAISYKGTGVEGGVWKPRDEQEWDATLDSWRQLVHLALQGIAAGDIRINLLRSTSESRPLGLLSRKEELKRAQ